MTGPTLTITGASPTPPRPTITVATGRTGAGTGTRARTIGLGADLARQPAIPSRRTTVPILIGLAGIFFALGVGVTLALHRPDAISFSAPASLMSDGLEVSRSALSLLGASPAQAASAADTPQPLTGSITLTAAQQEQIAHVLSLADRTAD